MQTKTSMRLLVTTTVFLLLIFASCTQKKEQKSQEADLKEIDLSLLPQKAFGPIDENSADTMATNYRLGRAVIKTHGIWYEMSAVKDFIDTVLLKNIAKVDPPAEYKWRLAISPIYVKKSSQARLSICFLPTLVHIKDSTVLDFFDHMAVNDTFYTKYYKPLLKLCKEDKDGKGSFIYDEGQLWP